jgi:hypothetical protein
MTRSSRVARTKRSPASHPTRGKAAREPSITRLGVTCFRLVALDKGTLGFATIQLASSTSAMAAFTWPRETRRERFQHQVTAMDRVIRETLALRPVLAS